MKIRSPYFKKQFDLQKAELIGKGTFAQVYRIFDADFNDSLAIRKVKKSLADLDDINKEKLINDELRKVDSENILKIYDIIDQSQAVWYITEYCSGGSLWDALNLCKDNKMNEKESLECVLQISKGIQELHNHRITHRDLKPQNILLKTKYVTGKPLPTIKLADFGLSTQKIIMETIAGTKQYIAPEQAKFHNYTNAVDVWSLGIIFDQILHGTPFYSGEDNKQVFNKILKTPFKVRDENLRISVKELLVSLLKKKPYQRPIIAVIRSTVEKILQQIDQNSIKGLEESKNKKSSNQNLKLQQTSKLFSDSKTKIITTPSKENLSVQTKKTYEINLKHEKQDKPFVEKLALSKQLSPKNKNVASERKEQRKQEEPIKSPLSRRQTKEHQKEAPTTQTKKVNEKEVKSRGIIKEKSKNQFKSNEKVNEDQKRQLSNNKDKQQSQNVVKSSQMIPINDKVTIYKKQKRKMIQSKIKRQEYKSEIIDLNVYVEKIFIIKKGLYEKHLILDKQHSFLPNTYFTANQYVEKCSGSEQPLRNFKRKMDFLNYLSNSEDYEIRLSNGQKQLKNNKQQCDQKLLKIQQTVISIFFGQLDNFIDHYVDKIIK